MYFCQLLINNSTLYYATHNGASGVANYNDMSFWIIKYAARMASVCNMCHLTYHYSPNYL
jgi:hypothetical protein